MTLSSFQKGKEYRIKYINNSGQISERKIRVISAYSSSYGTGYIRAWCYLRDEERTFRTDRVIGASLSSGRAMVQQNTKAEICTVYNHSAAAAASEPVRISVQNTREAEKFTPCLQECSSDAVKTETLNKLQQNKSNTESESFGSYLLKGAVYAITFIGLSMAGMGPGADIINPPAPRQAYSAGYVPAPQPLPRPAPPPAPSSLPVRYVEPGAPESRGAAGRAAAFRTASGITDPGLEKIYEAADLNRDGKLDWDEIERFQKMIYRKFIYKHNETALRPDDFLSRGGGDCEDWALFTCGMLQYWGIKAYVGGFYPEYGPGHAVALVYHSSSPPRKYSAYDIRNYPGIPDGWYVPIDYDRVGSLSNAVGKGWKLKQIFIPREIYGTYM